MKGINWLASYPKSGNTWMRIFLANYLEKDGKKVGINEIPGRPAASRQLFDSETGLESTCLTGEEIFHLRPLLYEWIASRSEEEWYMKTHDPLVEVSPNLPIISIMGTGRLIYIVRNPLDVAVSLADFLGMDIDRAISLMGRHNWTYIAREGTLLYCPWVSWSFHVESWVSNRWFPVHTVRYEDLKNSPIHFFGEVVRFLGIPFEEDRLIKAVADSDFHELKRQEEESPFKEKSPYSMSFFRKGIAGGWKEVLNEAQYRQIVDTHGSVMGRFGYLDDA